jgi:hypothetical protein
MSPPNAPGPTFRVRRWSQVTPRPVDWLWTERLAFGKLAMFDGDSGLGKTLVALDLCARLTTGRPMPDGSPGPPAAPVVIFNGEDTLADTTLARLRRFGADLDRVCDLEAEPDGLAAPWSFPRHLADLDRTLAETGARLVVLDPVVAFLDAGINSNNDQSVRRALGPLAALAARYHCAVLLIRHVNKFAGRAALYRGGGSIGFVSACRSAWLFGRDPEDPSRIVIAQVKNNLAPPQPSLAYRVVEQRPDPPELRWLGPTELKADQLVGSAVKVPAGDRPHDQAREALTDWLRASPRTSQEIWAAAQQEGIAERTLNRAKKELDITSKRVRVNGRTVSYWLLPGQELPADIPPEAVEPDLEPWMAPLREMFPAPTPLDDV